ncbi:fes/CIP4, and EFC/F-BAR homology domain-containing protein [Ditylenchus destructor]|uniref:Fes/CIP4, and EFC/F-BAR homology domain-containing protein n=1 Tax=Ditylenchus destructor TaxID=166010 RepID=A0AAD4QYE6_9BILA|nr:fes/CIP4, and EFC/F-BAR homology domain-containing protein [Ditylenchus destructor]
MDGPCHETYHIVHLPINGQPNNYNEDCNHYSDNCSNHYARNGYPPLPIKPDTSSPTGLNGHSHTILNGRASASGLIAVGNYHRDRQDRDHHKDYESADGTIYRKNYATRAMTLNRHSPASQHYQQPDVTLLPPPNNGSSNRRFSFIGLDDYQPIVTDIMSGKYSATSEKHHRTCSNLMVNKVGIESRSQSSADGKATLSRRAQKIAQKAQKLSLASISSELSSSASALYSLFTDKEQSGSGSKDNGPGGHYSNGNSGINSYDWTHGGWQLYIMDQTEAVSAHTQRGIEFLERYGQVVKEWATIEEEFAMKLRNLVKKCRNKKGDEEDLKVYSYMKAFYAMLGELDSLAAQHETIGEKMKREIVPSVGEKCQGLRSGRKKQLQNLHMLNSSFRDQVDHMAKLEKNYSKSFKDAQQAQVKYEKADKNRELSRLDVDKAKNNAIEKNQLCEQAKQSYAHGLESANHAQHEYYNLKLPNLLEEMRRLDVDRIESTKSAMMDTVSAERSVSKIVERCYNDMETAISAVNPENDTMAVVTQYGTGYTFPEDFKFNDLGNPTDIGNESMTSDSSTIRRNPGSTNVVVASFSKNSNGKAIPRKNSMHSRLFGGSSKGHSNNGVDTYGNLPPQQRCRKIQAKLDELSKEAATKEQSRGGLEKMLGVYKESPNMGNAADVETQMAQYTRELSAIYEQMERYKKMLLDAQSELNTPPGGLLHNPSPAMSPRVPPPPNMQSVQAARNNARSSYSEESVSSEGSGSLKGSLTTSHRSPHSLTAAANGYHSAAPRSHPGSFPPQANIKHIDAGSADFYEECDGPHPGAAGTANNGDELPPLGTCTALYPFDGNTDGTAIEMREGDEMLLVEKDEGDGWTRVRHINSQSEGFVPTSYLQLRWYPSR